MNEKRYYALDAIRAAMMLLGLVFHGVISYTEFDFGRGWPYKDAATTELADLLAFFIHVFRMPIFFLLAGFFSALLFRRRGMEGLLHNRLRRIAVPLVVGAFLLVPLSEAGFLFARMTQRAGLSAGFAAVAEGLAEGDLLFPSGTHHLWFLYDLLWFYAAALLANALLRRAPRLRASADRAFVALLARPRLRPIVLGGLTGLSLMPMGGYFNSSEAFVPYAGELVAYGVFFAFGWLLYLHRQWLPCGQRRAWIQVGLALGTFSLILPFGDILVPPEHGAAVGDVVLGLFLRSMLGGLVVWWLAFGLIGLCQRYADRPSSWVRYVVDASYWVYLVHYPVTIWCVGLLSPLPWSAGLKTAVVIAGAALFGFATYELFVRSTVIGQWLNGRRYPSHRSGRAPG